MPKSFDECVNDLIAQGKDENAAYAICVSNYIDKHGHSPFKSESELKEGRLPKLVHNALAPLVKEGNSRESRNMRLAKAVLEALASGKKAKIVNDVVR